MTGLNHALTGSAIALIVKRPILAIPLAFLSHFVIDAFPHWGNTPFYSSANPAYHLIVGTDGFLALVAIITICYFAPRDQIWLIITCAFCAMLPDAFWLLNHDTSGIIYNFNMFHKHIQWAERPWGFFVEILYAGGMSYLIFKILQKERKYGSRSAKHPQKIKRQN